MSKSNILIGAIVILFIVSIILELNHEELQSRIVKSLIVPSFSLLYFLTVSKRSKYFVWFLLLYSLSEITCFFEYLITTDLGYDIYYTFGNALYIIAYFFLLLEICKSFKLKNVVKNYTIHLIVLTALNIYIVYVLLTIVNPYVEGSYLYYIEAVYNIIILLLLTASLINYLYNESKKSLLLFFGSLCIVFSEVIQVAYFYISERSLLQIVSAVLFVVAFLFFYSQSKIENKPIKLYA